ncbi:MAG: glycosyltransferase family 2 protein [Pseudomonadota bacterium]
MQLSVVVPTFNEAANLAVLVERLGEALGELNWEVVFVDDDSPDGTAAEARRLGQENGRVRCLQRIDRRGLSSACIEGMLATSAPVIAVMDADLQHDERLLPRMFDTLTKENLDVVVGSRHVDGGDADAFSDDRAKKSELATRLSRMVVPDTLLDPMSGFFMITRNAFEASVRNLSGIGFKILMDLFASAPAPLRFKELPYSFGERHAGESKLDNQALWDYGMLLLDKLVGRWVPVRFVAFIAVGGIGVFVHMAVLALTFQALGYGFVTSQIWATLVAMTANFVINNLITYRDLQLKGWGWVTGWISFVLACSVGAVANVGVAGYLFAEDTGWFLAGLAGIVVGAVWNYAITQLYTWRAK